MPKKDVAQQAIPEKAEKAATRSLAERFRIPIACAGVLGLGTVTAVINAKHGIHEALSAGINQAIHSGISAAVLIKIHALLAKNVQTLKGEVVPIVVPAALTTLACYGIHSIGIPGIRAPSAEPVLSTIPTAIVITVVMPVYHIVLHGKRISEKIQNLFSK